MNWLKFCTDNYNSGNYDDITLKIFVVKGKITAQQYKDITTIDYIA